MWWNGVLLSALWPEEKACYSVDNSSLHGKADAGGLRFHPPTPHVPEP